MGRCKRTFGQAFACYFFENIFIHYAIFPAEIRAMRGFHDTTLVVCPTSIPILRVIISRVSPCSGSIPEGAPQQRAKESRGSTHQYHGHRLSPPSSTTLALSIARFIKPSRNMKTTGEGWTSLQQEPRLGSTTPQRMQGPTSFILCYFYFSGAWVQNSGILRKKHAVYDCTAFIAHEPHVGSTSTVSSAWLAIFTTNGSIPSPVANMVRGGRRNGAGTANGGGRVVPLVETLYHILRSICYGRSSAECPSPSAQCLSIFHALRTYLY